MTATETDARMHELATKIADHYLNSPDFNGYSMRNIGCNEQERRQLVRALVVKELVTVNFGDRHPNPHILAFEAETREVQLRKLEEPDLINTCVYPHKNYLAVIVDPRVYDGRPFSYRLALGEPQLEFAAFDLPVLERYRNDPRYDYQTDDVQGTISVSDAYYKSQNMREVDQILLNNFGFGYDQELQERVVIVFLRYLADLSPEHQQVWKAHELAGEYVPHPGFWSSAMGEWTAEAPIFVAFVEEQKEINVICELMGKPALFRELFVDDKRPRKFGFLIRPTLSEFNGFVQLLDRMLSDNINRRFFRGDLEMERLERRGDGTVVAKEKGTISLLIEWLAARFRPRDGDPVGDVEVAFREVRKLRQRPAHAVDEDVFDQEYLRKQRALMVRAYDGLRTLRQVLASHRRARSYRPPEWLVEGRIWTY